MTSIRKRLLVSIIGVLTLATIVVGVATYLGIRHEMDELYDANMRQLAVMTSDITIEGKAADAASKNAEWPRGEEIFVIQIWKDGKPSYTSHQIVDFPLQEKEGFGRIFFHDKKWTYYQENINGKTIQISQALHERRKVIREVYNAIIIPILIQFPVLSLIMWFLISYGFRPLSNISSLIQKRDASFMQPIAVETAPDEVKSLVAALNDLLARLKNSLETQRRFTADAAHELRTPLTAVRLQLDLLQRTAAEHDRAEAMSTLERGVDRSIHLVQQLLELARQQPDKPAEQFAPVQLEKIVTAVMEEQAALALAKSINMHADIQDVKVTGDADGLSVMIGNLLNNAITYTNPNGNISVGLHQDKGFAVLEISDDGIGIQPESRERIFDRFYRVIGTGQSGSGLGLSIVKAIANRHGIKILVKEGLKGKGTGFEILFAQA